MSDRIFSIIWLGVCARIIFQMWNLYIPFTYEPVGAKAFPLLLAGLMALCCFVLIINPAHNIHWPKPPLLGKGAILIGVLLGYSSMFEILGFPLSTTVMILIVSRIFGGRWVNGLIAGLVAGVFGYLFFDRLLGVSLPLGLMQYG